MTAGSGAINRNQKLLKIKGKLSSQYQHTQTIPNRGAPPQEEYLEREGSCGFLGVHEGDPTGQAAADDLQKHYSRVGPDQQQFPTDQENSQLRINSQSNSQQ